MSGGLGVSDTIEQFFSNQLVSFPEVADEFSSLASDYNKKYVTFWAPTLSAENTTPLRSNHSC